MYDISKKLLKGLFVDWIKNPLATLDPLILWPSWIQLINAIG
jgi:hypothetical protein